MNDGTESTVRSFLNWLAREAPQVHQTLSPPATEASLDRLVTTCGALPDSFLELYRMHDGQVAENIAFVPYHYLLRASSVVGVWENQQTYEGFTWKKIWIPFARFDCDYLCLDAKSGAVLVFFLKFAARPVIARSFDHFLEQIRASVEQGKFIATAEGLTEDPDADLAWTAEWERACKPRKRKASTAKKSKAKKSKAKKSKAKKSKAKKPKTKSRR